MASASKAASGPMITCTFSRSTSSCVLVLAPAGLPPVSAMISSTLRPAMVLLRSLRKSWMPCSICLPPAASGPLRALEKSAQLKDWPVIARTLRTLSNVRVRNVATVGGALAHGDPHMDLPPLLSALGATVTIAGPGGERTSKVEDIYVGYLETTLKPGELITQVRIPALGGRQAAYLKCTTRSADDWPALGMAVALDAERASIVLGAATDRPTRLAAAEKVLSGKPITDVLPAQAAEAAR